MRVTLVIDGLGPGGAQRVLTTMANYWVAKGWQITLVTLAGRETPPAFPLQPAVTLVPLSTLRPDRGPIGRILGKAGHVTALRRAIAQSRPQAVIAFLDKINVLTLLATRGLGIPIIVSERTDPNAYSVGRLWEALRAWTYPAAAALVAQSASALSYFPRVAARADVVIPNPVAPATSAWRVGRGSEEAHLVVGLGRLGPEKGFDWLLEAFARLAPRFPDWRLEIWGEGPERAALQNRRDGLGLGARVRFPGVTREPAEVLRSADVFVLSSRFEGFPNALCEAMACGLPVISTDCASGPREIVRDGIDGILVPLKDGPVALARALERLMADPDERRRLAARAPEVLERFSVDRIMAQWETVLATVTQP